MVTAKDWAAAIGGGVLLGVVYTLSPLSLWFAVAGAALVWGGGYGLPPREQRWVRRVILAALATRALLIAALFLFGTSDHGSFNVFFGDEQYLLVRSQRLRNLWLGVPLSLEALFDLFDEYGQTSYLNVIAYVQLLVGPAPYGIHLLNSLFYVIGTVVLHRIVRAAFGRVPALIGLFGMLFFPTLLIWSASGLKESLTFVVVTLVLAAAILLVHAEWRWRPLAAAAMAAGIAALGTFRAGAFEIAAIGVAGGLAGRFVTRRVWRVVLVSVLILAAAAPVLRSPRIQSEALRVLTRAARIQMGHVYTRGHAYKLLDQHFYDAQVASTMTWSEGVRFVRRAIVSVILFPTPWSAQSRAELAYLPEQMAWYVILLTSVVGIVAGVRRDALVTMLFTAYAMAALLVVALHTGNIGTLVRHRAFALPFLIALSAVGVTAVAARLRVAARPGRR